MRVFTEFHFIGACVMRGLGMCCASLRHRFYRYCSRSSVLSRVEHPHAHSNLHRHAAPAHTKSDKKAVPKRNPTPYAEQNAMVSCHKRDARQPAAAAAVSRVHEMSAAGCTCPNPYFLFSQGICVRSSLRSQHSQPALHAGTLPACARRRHVSHSQIGAAST